jgi:hypothetical protein
MLVSVLLGALWLGMSVGASFHFHLDGAYHNDCPECNFQKNLFSADLQPAATPPIHFVSIQQLVERVPQILVFFLNLSQSIRPPPIPQY